MHRSIRQNGLKVKFSWYAEVLKKEKCFVLFQLLFAVHKAVTKSVPVLSTDAITDRIILQVDSVSSK